jgi:hypothetical protein
MDPITLNRLTCLFLQTQNPRLGKKPRRRRRRRGKKKHKHKNLQGRMGLIPYLNSKQEIAKNKNKNSSIALALFGFVNNQMNNQKNYATRILKRSEFVTSKYCIYLNCVTYVFCPKFQKMVPKSIAETKVNAIRTRL